MNGDSVTGRLNRIESSLEASIILSRKRFEMVDERFRVTEQRFEGMDRRFTESTVLEEERLDEVNSRLNRQFTVLMVAFGSIFAGTVTILVNGFAG
ncbi:MAG: hypothetical protein RQ801_09490 [Spirochaetaceae bacterium]|nr:hypothetical protein [Spirochaetaceae bacterium]MDT8298520.1 hypothetical protein [Spirochaetaceae bacterium]